MKKFAIKKYTLIILTLMLAFAMCACTVDPSDDGSDTETITVTMNIDFPDGDDYPEDFENFTMQVESGATVMEITESFSGQEDLELILDQTSPTVYVTSIEGIASEGNMGWMYYINGEMVMEEAAKCTPEDGDMITWEYASF